MGLRIGQGVDVHAFCEGDHVMLGGVKISHTRGLVAHSDGDVALHALCDALLGAIGQGDIGHHFPPGENQWRNIASSELLARVTEKVAAAGYSLVNADMTIICESPRIAPHIDAMRERIAPLLNVTPDRISVKATTSEKLGFCGRGEGIAASAIVLLQS